MKDELSAPPMTSVDASTSGSATVAAGPSELSLLVITLFKGPMYREVHDRLWPQMLKLRARVADHVAVMGLRLEVDENEGYAFLRGLRDDETDVEYPRLVNRHTLGFHTSLLIALLAALPLLPGLPGQFVFIDGRGSVEEVERSILAHIEPLLA